MTKESVAASVMVAAWTCACALVHAQTHPQSGPDSDTVRYPAAFFSSYHPVNARDMVEQVPGFRIRDGGAARGFGGTAGNVLINGERPSSKQDTVSQILERIPANRVTRIDLIRGNTGRFDAGSQSQLVNIIVDREARSWTWTASIEQDIDSGGPTPGASLSMVDRIANTEWGAGVEISTSFIGNDAREELFESGRVVEDRDEFERFRSQSIQLNLNSTTRLDASVLRFNGEVEFEDSDFRERSRRTPLAASQPAFNRNRRSDSDELEYELGIDYEWQLGDDWVAKAIALRRREREDEAEQDLLGESNDSVEVRQETDETATETETITRLELDWSGPAAHLVELDFEAALNSLDNELRLLARRDGELVEVEVPGANNRVEEVRGDAQVRDTWEAGAISVESALGAEFSEIRQSAAGVPDQQFFFLKPSITLIHTPDRTIVNRLNLSREVSQLDFNDFVSSTNFSDDDLDRGNPGLEPQNTWLVEASSERRFGEVGVAKLTAFHRWVRDVEDQLPIGDRFEVPGNIGDGRRWGLEFEGTVPLMALGLEESRLDIEAGWEDSSVTDPVSGRTRRFSDQRKYRFESEFRQELIAQRWAWGFETEYLDESTVFELDEIDIDDRGFDLEFFIETTRYLGVKMQLVAQNLLDRKLIRDRTVFAGPRDTADVEFRELRERRRGRSLLLSVSGSF